MNRSIKSRIEKLEEKTNAAAKNTEFLKALAEVEKIVEQMKKEYNSPEAVAQRQREYEELQRIGEKRKAAFYRGESMDQYPLPIPGQKKT